MRKIAKVSCTQLVQVKLQVVNLIMKMYLTNPVHTKLISQYVFNLAKFEQNYDLRDRARFIRAILFTRPRESQARYLFGPQATSNH